MSCLVALLSDAGKSVEGQLKSQLNGMFGGFVRGYLPQRWVFVTDDGIATLGVDATGDVWAKAGADPTPDVVIETTHAKLSAALRTRGREALPPGEVKVTPKTAKGRTAFDFVRSRLGL